MNKFRNVKQLFSPSWFCDGDKTSILNDTHFTVTAQMNKTLILPD